MSTDAVRQDGPMTRSRRLVLRTAYLLLGAAIFVAFLLVQIGLGQLMTAAWGTPLPIVVLVVVVPLLLVGFLPGLREVEVAAARTLLGVESELVVPNRPHWAHRWRSAAWVLLHLLVGGIAGLGLVAGVPAAVSGTWSLATGRTPTVRIPGLDSLAVPRDRVLLVGAMIVIIAVLLLVTVFAGRLMAWLAPRLLGPTWRDRLDLAEARLQAEAEHRRLARELHDGVGHALSIISLQSAAGRRVLDRDPETAGRSLHTIETTARQALDELDQLLGVLRSADAARTPKSTLADLDTLVAAHRDTGLEIATTLQLTEPVPALLSSTAYRIASEGLTNARKHGAGSAALAIDSQTEALMIEVRSPLPNRALHRRGQTLGGRGLTGIEERVAVFGGTCTSGPVGPDWVLRVELPRAVPPTADTMRPIHNDQPTVTT